jgi:hypothetical protein
MPNPLWGLGRTGVEPVSPIRRPEGCPPSWYLRPVRAWDEDDWVGEPPEGRYTADRADPGFWRRGWQASVAGAGICLALLILLIVWLLS